MRYAKSLLLCGQIIDAQEVEPDTYQELLCVCPISEKKVKLVTYPWSGPRKDGEPPVIHVWIHDEKISYSELNECNEKNQSLSTIIEIVNRDATKKRLKLFQPHLWELIMSSPLFQKPMTMEGYDLLWKNNLTSWLAYEILKLCRTPEFQAQAKEKCEKSVPEQLKRLTKDKNFHISIVANNILTDKKLHSYKQQIAGEALEFACQKLDDTDLRRLIYLGVDGELYKRMLKFASKVKCFAISFHPKMGKIVLYQKGEPDPQLNLSQTLADAKTMSVFGKNIQDEMDSITQLFIFNLSIIFSSIAWIDKLKKLNK